MNVVDVPQPCSQTLYDEAVARYAGMVRSRAASVHQVGCTQYPGLSHVALIVVTDHVGLDNRFFFSAQHRLPERYHRLFLHEPFILPAWSLRVMRYTKHYARRLITGRETLAAYRPSDDRNERWCRMLESYCGFAALAHRNRRAQHVKGRETLAAAASLRHVFREAAHVFPQAADLTYLNAVDVIRRRFFDEGNDPVEQIRAAWDLFAGAFDRFDAVMQLHLGAKDTQEAVHIARARLRGEQECSDFDREYAFRRACDISGYQHELASLGFPFGHLFSVAAHPLSVQAPRAVSVVETLLRNLYHVRRRLTERVARA